jgi:hypothetical protein
MKVLLLFLGTAYALEFSLRKRFLDTFLQPETSSIGVEKSLLNFQNT